MDDGLFHFLPFLKIEEDGVSESEHVRIFDTTLRDGEQSPGCSMTCAEKLGVAHQLDKLGVDVIEAGFPVASEGDFHSVCAVAQEVRRPIVAALARSRTADIERAWEALKPATHPRIHTFLATSDIHLQYKLKISRRECLEQARDAVRLAKSFCEDVEFSPEDASRTDVNFLCAVLEAVIQAGATTVNIPDTVGYSTPSEFAELIYTIRRRIPGSAGVTISVHCHDDLGLAVANSLAAVCAGARQVECTINGIGERAGNASLEEFVMATHVRADRYPYQTSIHKEQLFPTSELLCQITGVPVHPHKAIVGRNAFAHEAGIHQDGVIKNPITYEIMTPQSVGVPQRYLALGKHSGRNALRVRCESLGFKFDSAQLDAVYCGFIELADKFKKIDDRHILEVIRKTQSHALSIAGNTAAASPQQEENGQRINSSRETEQEGAQEDYLWGV